MSFLSRQTLSGFLLLLLLLGIVWPAQAAPGRQEEAAQVLLALARAQFEAEAYDEARLLLLDLLERYPASPRAGEARKLLAESLRKLGEEYAAQDGFVQAEALLSQAAALYRELAEPLEEANVLNRLGYLARTAGYDEAAIQPLAQALAIYRDLDDRSKEAVVLASLGYTYRSLEQFDRSIDYLEQAVALYHELENRESEAVQLANLGYTYRDMERFDQAADHLEQAVAIFKALGKRESESVNLSNLGYVFFDQGKFEAALDMFQRAAAIDRERAAASSEALNLVWSGYALSELQRHEEALAMHEQGLNIYRELANRTQEAYALRNLAFVYNDLGQHAESLENYRAALALMQELGNQFEAGLIFSYIGFVYSDLTQHAQALESHQAALALMQALDNPYQESLVWSYIGFVYSDLGLHAQALESHRAALGLIREAGNRYQETLVLTYMGGVYTELNRYGEALATFQQALGLQQAQQDRFGEANTLDRMATVYGEQGRFDEALALLAEALAIQQEIGDRLGEANIHNNTGVLYWKMAEHERSLSEYEAALTIYRELEDPASEWIALNNIGESHREQFRFTEALSYSGQALELARVLNDTASIAGTLSEIGRLQHRLSRYERAIESYEQALPLYREVANLNAEAILLVRIGEAYSEQERYADALAAYEQALAIRRQSGDRVEQANILDRVGQDYEAQADSDRALEIYLEAIELLESVRLTAGSEEGRAEFIARQAGLYERAVRLSHRQGLDEQAFLITERGRARAFLDSLATGNVQLSDNDADALLRQERELYDQRRALQDNLARLRLDLRVDAEQVAELEAQLAEVEAAYAAAQAAITAGEARLAALIPGRSQSVLDLAGLQAQLDPQTTLLSYYVMTDQTLAFVISRDDFRIVALEPGRQTLRDQVNNLRLFASLDEAYPDSAVQLYEALIEPMAPYLATPHLAIVPHNVLHYLPFAALTGGEPPAGDGQFLIDAYTLTTLPSASALPFIAKNAADRKEAAQQPAITGEDFLPALVIGNPVIDIPGPPAGATAQNSPPGMLIYAQKEATMIAGLYGVDALVRENGTEQTVWAQAGRARILHLAAHGAYNSANPLYSALFLAPSAELVDSRGDGRLEAREIYSLNLSQTHLVVLSACQTQLGDLNNGDEVVGLSRAFFFAGTPSVIASLWSVEDQATGLLMERFYTHLKAGLTKAEALRQAQIETRETYPNPFFWAAFVLSGDGGTGGS